MIIIKLQRASATVLGLRALHYAALKGDETTIEMLCLHGAAVNEPCIYGGNSALHLAAQYGHYSAVCLSVCLSHTQLLQGDFVPSPQNSYQGSAHGRCWGFRSPDPLSQPPLLDTIQS